MSMAEKSSRVNAPSRPLAMVANAAPVWETHDNIVLSKLLAT